MTIVWALLAGTSLLGVYGQRLLTWLADRRVDPTILLTGWVLSAVSLLASTLAILALFAALPADDHHLSGIFGLAGGCWTALSSGETPAWREAAAAVSVLGAGVVLARLAWAAFARWKLRRQRRPYLAQLRLLAAGTASGEPLWVREDQPLALSIGGRPGLIVMSDALRRDLTTAAVRATLEHERAHLRGRHHLLLAVVETLAAALPMCPLLRAAPAAVKDLVELAADARAARRCGPAAVHEALCGVTGQAAPAFGLAMAGRLTHARLMRLAVGNIGASPAVRLAGSTALALVVLALPVLTGLAAVHVVGCAIT
jgi:Zn-dependent protease with chaperone function